MPYIEYVAAYPFNPQPSLIDCVLVSGVGLEPFLLW